MPYSLLNLDWDPNYQKSVERSDPSMISEGYFSKMILTAVQTFNHLIQVDVVVFDMATKMGEHPNSLTRIRLFMTSNNKWLSYFGFPREVCLEITNMRDISLLFHFAGITEVRRMITMMLVVVVFVVKFTRVRSLPGFVSDFQTPVWYCWWRCQLKRRLFGG